MDEMSVMMNHPILKISQGIPELLHLCTLLFLGCLYSGEHSHNITVLLMRGRALTAAATGASGMLMPSHPARSTDHANALKRRSSQKGLLEPKWLRTSLSLSLYLSSRSPSFLSLSISFLSLSLYLSSLSHPSLIYWCTELPLRCPRKAQSKHSSEQTHPHAKSLLLIKASQKP